MGSQCLRWRRESWIACPSQTSGPRTTAIPGRSLALRLGLCASTSRPLASKIALKSSFSFSFFFSFSFLFIMGLETCCSKSKPPKELSNGLFVHTFSFWGKQQCFCQMNFHCANFLTDIGAVLFHCLTALLRFRIKTRGVFVVSQRKYRLFLALWQLFFSLVLFVFNTQIFISFRFVLLLRLFCNQQIFFFFFFSFLGDRVVELSGIANVHFAVSLMYFFNVCISSSAQDPVLKTGHPSFLWLHRVVIVLCTGVTHAGSE